jgi:RHS repeat-associated protein
MTSHRTTHRASRVTHQRRPFVPTLRQQLQSFAAGAALLCTAWLGVGGGAAAAPNNAMVSVAEDPFSAGRVYNLPKAGSSPVNLLTGDMQFSLPLGSIGGRNGLAYAVSARYSSNVMSQASAWNGDQPTGAMGLGWKLDFPKVIVDTHGQTQQSGNDYYTPSGNIYLPNGSLVTQSQPVPFLYQGLEYDWQSELHNFGMRSYDSDMVNFMQPDPQFSVGQSPYVAMDNDPVN